MSELLWIFPILASIALVLGGCRGVTMARMLKESGLSFARLVVGVTVLCIGVQVLLLIVGIFR